MKISDKTIQLSALFQFQMGRSQHFELSDPRSLVAFVTSGHVRECTQAAAVKTSSIWQHARSCRLCIFTVGRAKIFINSPHSGVEAPTPTDLE